MTVEYIPGAVGPQLAVLETGDAVAREQPVQTSHRDSLVSPKSSKLRRLEEELEKVKADLKRPETPVDNSGDASQPGTSHQVGFQRKQVILNWCPGRLLNGTTTGVDDRRQIPTGASPSTRHASTQTPMLYGLNPPVRAIHEGGDVDRRTVNC